MSFDSLAGRTYGPVPFRVCAEKVGEFLDVTGDDPDRWAEAAPPGFAAAFLFAVTPLLLADPEVRAAARSVIHGDQGFTWHRPIPIEETLMVTGSIDRVRTRNDVHFVSFGLRVEAADGAAVAEGSSTFLMSAAAAIPGNAAEHLEPDPEDRADHADGWVAASRSDLVRYAGATRDWNPVHWDHDAAVASGLPGVVVHGLLQAAWVCARITRGLPGDRPLASARFRFRSPLRPAVAVEVRTRVEAAGGIAADLVDADQRYLGAVLEPVTP